MNINVLTFSFIMFLAFMHSNFYQSCLHLIRIFFYVSTIVVTYHINVSNQQILIKLLALSILPLNNSDLSAAVFAYIAVSSPLLTSKSIMISCIYQSNAVRPIAHLLELSNTSRQTFPTLALLLVRVYISEQEPRVPWWSDFALFVVPVETVHWFLPLPREEVMWQPALPVSKITWKVINGFWCNFKIWFSFGDFWPLILIMSVNTRIH